MSSQPTIKFRQVQELIRRRVYILSWNVVLLILLFLYVTRSINRSALKKINKKGRVDLHDNGLRG